MSEISYEETVKAQQKARQDLFRPLGETAEAMSAQAADGEDDRQVTEIDSYCMGCHEQGVTRLLLSFIPYFREVIVMSFRCEHCGLTNNEIKSASEIQIKGTTYTVKIQSAADLDRQVVRSATATVALKELELEIPPKSGSLTTVEGLLRDVMADLSMDQPLRKALKEPAYEKIENICQRLSDMLPGTTGENEAPVQPKKDFPELTFILRDPTGNSFLEFLGTSATDKNWTFKEWPRTKEENVALGLVAAEGEEEASTPLEQLPEIQEADEKAAEAGQEGDDKEGADTEVPEEVVKFFGTCSSCGHPADTLMKAVDIPYFKDIMIISTTCNHCGYKDNEVKSGGAVSQLGRKISLLVEDSGDLSRDVLKSETCGLEIPEIDLVLQPGTLGGRFTTLEGLLKQIHDELSERVFANEATDSVQPEAVSSHKAWKSFLTSLNDLTSGEKPFNLILDDPLANSYIQNPYAPDADPNMKFVDYERTQEQNDELGLSDMVLENYNEYGDQSEPAKAHVNAGNTS